MYYYLTKPNQYYNNGRKPTSVCNINSINILGKTFDKINNQGQVIFQSTAGCDSIVFINVFFNKNKIDTIFKSLNAEDSLVVNGQVFNKDRLEGLILLGPTKNGVCDSLLYVKLFIIKNSFSNVQVFYEDEKCFKQQSFISIDKIDGCKDPKIYLNSIEFTPNKLPFTIDNILPGKYVLEIISDDGCYYIEEIIIEPADSTALFNLNNDKFYIQKDQPSITLSIEPKPSKIEWNPSSNLSCDNCLNPSFLSIIDSQELEITLYDDNGCSENRSVQVFIENDIKIILPNIINLSSSTNGSFVLEGTEDFQIKQFSVYDRWGNIIFHSKSSNYIDWKGDFNGTPVIPGVYVYHLEILFYGGKSKNIVSDITVVK